MDAEPQAFEHMLKCVHALSDCAKEFYPDYPEALSEHVEALSEAMDNWQAAVDARTTAPLALPEYVA